MNHIDNKVNFIFSKLIDNYEEEYFYIPDDLYERAINYLKYNTNITFNSAIDIMRITHNDKHFNLILPVLLRYIKHKDDIRYLINEVGYKNYDFINNELLFKFILNYKDIINEDELIKQSLSDDVDKLNYLSRFYYLNDKIVFNIINNDYVDDVNSIIIINIKY